MKRELTCIICPRGCLLTAEVENGAVTVRGNGCPRGATYAETECTHPQRTVTSTVRVANRENTMVSVKTREPVDKADMFKVIKRLRAAAVNAPVAIGDIVLADVCGTDIVATKAID